MGKRIIPITLYLLSIIAYVTYLITLENIYMLFGGLLLLTASITMLIINKKR